MAQFQSLYSYRPNPKPEDMFFQLQTGEAVQLLPNDDVFQENGQLKPAVKFSVGQDVQLFTLSWPIQCLQKVTTQSRWRLVLTQATTDRIPNFTAETAENLCSNSWEVVKDVCCECHKEFGAYLISMSCQEVIFTHRDSPSAEIMKESNEMVDIMNKLLADTEVSYCDIMVDWDVSVEPCQHISTPPSTSNFSSLVFDGDPADGDSLHSASSTASEGGEEEGPSPLQLVLEMIQRESQKSQEALAKMSADSERRHRMVCHHLEEIKNTLHDFEHRLCLLERGQKAEGERIDRGSAASTCSYQQQDMQDRSNDSHHRATSETSTANGAPDEPPRSSPPPYPDRTVNKQPNYGREDHAPDESKSHENFCERDTSKASETFTETGEKTVMSGSALENHKLDEAVQRAYRHDDVSPPKAKSYHTVLCLDISDSMVENDAADEMIRIVNEFIDGVEDIVSETGVEENIGVVTFGGTSNVEQNLTNDFSLVRRAVDAIEFGGRSPFVQAILVSMAAFVEKAGIISVSGVYDVKPRIIFISDGYPTENTEDGTDVAVNKMHVRSALTKLMMDMATKDKYDRVRPVVYIPVGEKADKGLMQSMATLSQGVYMEPTEEGIKKLCSYFVLQETIGKTLACLKKRSRKDEHDDKHIQAVITSLMPTLTKQQQDEVMAVVKKELKDPTKKQKRHHIYDFDDVFEDTDKVNAGERLPLGTRVIRGPDWRWGDQDNGGAGTVFTHTDKTGWTWVCWDTGELNRYSYGTEEGYHIWKTDKHPRFMKADGELELGMTVEKGPTWQCTSENLLGVKTGVVIRKSKRDKKLMVRWDNGERQIVQYGCEDKFDVIYRDPMEIETDPPFEFESFYAGNQAEGGEGDTQPKQQRPPAEDFANGLWQWKDGGGWQNYPPKLSDTIEGAYKKKPKGSCIVNREGSNRRVMFRRMVERVVDGGVEIPVRRVPVHAS